MCIIETLFVQHFALVAIRHDNNKVEWNWRCWTEWRGLRTRTTVLYSYSVLYSQSPACVCFGSTAKMQEDCVAVWLLKAHTRKRKSGTLLFLPCLLQICSRRLIAVVSNVWKRQALHSVQSYVGRIIIYSTGTQYGVGRPAELAVFCNSYILYTLLIWHLTVQSSSRLWEDLQYSRHL